LVGIWAREEAKGTLNRPRPYASRRDAVKKLQERSEIWRSGPPALEDQLWSMFINPACTVGPGDRMEPDKQPIDQDCPRSAILFGPPGTSKTTLVKALAGCVQWDYIELHASHFVADGLPNVQKTADRIFKYLSELDHAVVLFDEVDELVRAREIEKDAFGRFLTTSMLPKLAELWEARKIMYFVATNHIEYFDPAITRSQRFDAVLFVSPPSFESKKRQLEKILREQHGIAGKLQLKVEQRDIQESLERFKCGNGGKEVPADGLLAKFALLRFDELGELAMNLMKALQEGQAITKEILAGALGEIHDVRWRGPDEYSNYLRGPSFERLDLTKEHVWRIKGLPKGLSSVYIKERNERPTLVARVRSLNDVSIVGHQIVSLSHGRVRIIQSPSVQKGTTVKKRPNTALAHRKST
jgi:hypothetical protein